METRKARRQADIGEQSPRKPLFPLLGEGLRERVFSWHPAQNEGTQDCANAVTMRLRIKSAIANYYGQGSRRLGFLPQQKSYRPNVLTSSRLKQSPLTLTLSRTKVNSPGRGNNINSPKWTYRLNVLSPYRLKKCAFTLAEVLITLGIIGVVAAITIPTLVSKYQMKVFETAFKKQYSVLQNAINYTVQVEGISACYFTHIGAAYQSVNSDCKQLRQSLVSLLQLQSIEQDYYKDYNFKEPDDVIAEGGNSVNIHCNYKNYSYWGRTWYSTKDGAILMFGSDTAPVLIIDVNGKKGPNKWGYDVFFMTFSNHNQYNSQEQKIFLTDEFCSLVEKGGRLPRTILTNKEKTEDDDFTIFWNR